MEFFTISTKIYNSDAFIATDNVKIFILKRLMLNCRFFVTLERYNMSSVKFKLTILNCTNFRTNNVRTCICFRNGWILVEFHYAALCACLCMYECTVLSCTVPHTMLLFTKSIVSCQKLSVMGLFQKFVQILGQHNKIQYYVIVLLQ